MSDADRVFIAQIAQQVGQAVYIVGALIAAIFWAPALLSPFVAITAPEMAGLVTILLLLSAWDIHQRIRGAQQKLLDSLDNE